MTDRHSNPLQTMCEEITKAAVTGSCDLLYVIQNVIVIFLRSVVLHEEAGGLYRPLN